MKKYLFACVLVAALTSCTDAGNTAEGKSNATANDSTQAPNGVTSPSAISTNPNATKTDTTQ